VDREILTHNDMCLKGGTPMKHLKVISEKPIVAQDDTMKTSSMLIPLIVLIALMSKGGTMKVR